MFNEISSELIEVVFPTAFGKQLKPVVLDTEENVRNHKTIIALGRVQLLMLTSEIYFIIGTSCVSFFSSVAHLSRKSRNGKQSYYLSLYLFI